MVATAPVDVSEHYATKSELVEIKAVLPHLATKADLAALQVAVKEDLTAGQEAMREDMAAFQTSMKEDMAAFQTATKEDMAAFQTATKEDIAGLQAGFAMLREDMATFQSGLAALQENTRKDMAILQANIQTSIETGIAAAKSDMERGLRNTIFILVGVMMAGYATLIGALIVAILATGG